MQLVVQPVVSCKRGISKQSFLNVCVIRTSAKRLGSTRLFCRSALYASAYVVRAAAGSDVISCSSRDHVVRSDVRNVWCVVVAVLMYYFGVAGAIWWAVLTISWYLAAARKVKHSPVISPHVGFTSCSWKPELTGFVKIIWLGFECRAVVIRVSKIAASYNDGFRESSFG